MTEDQRLRLNVARAFALEFIKTKDDDVEVAAMQLHAALEELAHAYEGEMMARCLEEDTAFFEEDHYLTN